MSERLRFLGKFLIFATIIFALFFVFGYKYYHHLFGQIAWLVYKPKIPTGESITIPVRFYNIIPFLALMLATPKIKIFSRLKRIGLGLIIIFFVHFLFIVIGHTYSYEHPTLLQRNLASVLNAIGQVAFPFVVWFVLAHKYIIKTFRPRPVARTAPYAMEQTCTICGKVKKGLREHIQSVHGKEKGIEKVLKMYGG